ncbi:hypothetical protein CDL15_Pgr010432 [Punica granatum]|uniref:Uncharacterized protein n=1 Tax=Punica granatum TaxID=22663 RepID=A0A218W2M6_PUNGR|nr:hypothetical protein CDL15_Pgr010432 [Punica granatum]PKI48702.1 hypothetical protein CRG98_030919 [Punica granatum]
MAMDPRFDDLSFSIDDFNFDDGRSPLPDSNQSLNFVNGVEPDEPALGFDSVTVPPFSTQPVALNYVPVISTDDLDGELVFPGELGGGSLEPSVSTGTGLSAGGESPSSSDDSDSSDPVLKYISQMLMEENMEEKIWISPDAFALQHTEKSLYDALGERYPDSPDQFHNFDVSQFIESPSGNFSGSSSDHSSVGTVLTSTNSSNSIDPSWRHDTGEYNQTTTPAVHALHQVPQSDSNYSLQFYTSSLSNSIGDANELVDSSVLVKNIFTDNDSVLQFKRGLEEASKFLPPSSQLVINFENGSSGSETKSRTSWVAGQDDKSGREDMLGGSRGRKNHEREDAGFEEGRATKQSASYVEAGEAELSEMFDKVLLAVAPCSTDSCRSTDASQSKDLRTSAQVRGSNGGRGRGRRQGNQSSVDLRTLLILCAQALSSNDLRTANELLKQIRQNSSPSGDGSQRLAHYFANGLEARMAGNGEGTQNFCHAIVMQRRSVADVLKGYQLHISSCPFKKLTIMYMNYMILKLSEKASVLHIIDFGIAFGFQWPILIQKLGEQPGGSPKLRITGIELPQPGFRPAERIEETGQRLAQYCKRFNVPFEFNALPSRNWETIRVEDLKIRSGEMIAVNCLYRFSSLLDETVDEDSPRDAVLKLIREIKPDVFVHTITNGSYNAPFFVTRFREALFHLSSIYDMFDATITGQQRDSKERTILESEFYGREIMNVVACEGPERVDRPESYKQWQVRHGRAGFKQLPLEQEVMKKLRHKLECWYHKDFVLDEDGNWMLLGWKGRIIYATTCWVPS